MSTTPTWKIHLALFSVALIYGSTYTIAKGIMPQLIGPSGFILIRVGIAALVFSIVERISGPQKILDKKDYVHFLVASIFGVAMNMLLFFNGLSQTNELNASVLMLNSPVFVLIFSALIFRQRIRLPQVAGILIAGVGALLLIGGTSFKFSSATAQGDLMIIMNAISFAFYLVYVKRLVHKYSVLTITKYIFLFGFILVLPFGLGQLIECDFSLFQPKDWLSLGFVAIATTCFAYFVNAWAVQKANSALVGSYIYLQPVVAATLATVLNKGVLSLERVIFALCIFAGVYLVGKSKKTA